MVEIEAVYDGQLHCRVIHGPSQHVIDTDAPVDNHGRGETFSPTDLVAAALASCILTVMGLVAERHQLDLTGTRAVVMKDMVEVPHRRISRLAAIVTFARSFAPEDRALLERAATHCPVHHSLHPEIEASVRFVYPG